MSLCQSCRSLSRQERWPGCTARRWIYIATGAVKTTSTDAMTFITGNKPIQELIKRKGSAAKREAAQNPRSVLENIRKQVKKSKDAEWIYTESNK